jgi:ABC-type nitrate/sulfonate/bicarbonate transport system substrate-binding protein
MQTRSFPILAAEDEPLVDALAIGLDRDTARVLAYLLLRADRDDVSSAAPRVAVRVGTDLGADPARDALATLAERDLVTATTVNDASPGRPPKRWERAVTRDEARTHVYEHHAADLLDHARTVAAALGDSSAFEGTFRERAGVRECAVALNWRPNGFHAPLFLAAERGLYRDADLSVSFTAARGSGEALEWVRSGRCDVGIAGAATLCRALADDTAVVPVALLYQRTMTVLYTVRSVFGDPFTGLDQLAGRTVAMPSGSETAHLARLLLAQADLLDAVEIVDSDGEERSALLDGTADVVTGMAADPPELDADGYTVDTVAVADRFPVPGPALVARADRLAEEPAVLERFLVGTMHGLAAARGSPPDAARAVARRSDSVVDAERRRFAVAHEREATADTARTHGWGWQSVDRWERLRTALRQADAGGERV